MSKYNPWDATIWDPSDSEHGTEDRLHGPSAVYDLLQIPAMPFGDGTYHQPGAFYLYGTARLDSQDRPVARIGRTSMAAAHEKVQLQEWVTAYQEGGGEALVELEASRQQRRLEETGFAHCYKPSDVCPGGKRLEDCAPGSAAYNAAAEWAAKTHQEKPDEGRRSRVLTWAGGTCVGCAVSCQAAVNTVDGIPQETRITFCKPDPTLAVISVDLHT